jgi:arylsulfatase A-like enzyme
MKRNPDGLGDQKSTVLYQLRTQLGYRTAFFGKYLNGWDLDVRPPHLDRWAIFPNSSPDGYYNATWNVDGRKKKVATYSTEYIRRRGERFIRNNADQPWLMYLSTAASHPPFDPEPKYEDAVASGWRRWKRRHPSVESGDLSGKHPSMESKLFPLPRVREIRRMQLRTLMSVDDLVASVMRTLGREEERRNTLVFFLSDNGFFWGEHGGLIRKMAPYTRSIKVPMMMRWPQGGIEPGTKDRRLVANIDLAASIYDAVGLQDTPPVDGRSLLDPSWDRDRLHFEYYAAHQLPTWASTLTRDYQYVEWYEDEEGTTVDLREYYDLRTDPHQMENLAADPSSRRSLDLRSLSAQLAADRICSGENCP